MRRPRLRRGREDARGASASPLPALASPRRRPKVELALAVTILIATALNAVLGAAGVLLLLLAGGALFALHPLSNLRALTRQWWLLLWPVLCIASTFWSSDPDYTLHVSVQLLATFLIYIVLCTRLDESEATLCTFIAYSVFVVLSLIALPSALSHHAPLIGLTGSKNQMSFSCAVLFGSACAVAGDRARRPILRLAALGGGALGLAVSPLTQSAGGLITFAVFTACFLASWAYRATSARSRPLFIVLGLILSAPLLLTGSAASEAWETFQFEVLHKDSTLTGRTYVWGVARRLIAEKPWFGHGFSAFWRPGNLDAEGLWRYAGITSRSGFNFHNSTLEVGVDLGYVGMALFLGTLVVAGLLGLWRLIRRPSVAYTFFFGQSAALFLRATTEGVFGTYSINTFLLSGLFIYATVRGSAPAGVPRRREFQRHRRRGLVTVGPPSVETIGRVEQPASMEALTEP